LASIYHTLGRNAEELKLLKKIVKLRTAKLGHDDPETLSSMHGLAECYAGLGRHAEALKFKKERLRLLTATLGGDHPDTLRCMDGVAQCYRNLGRHAEALKLHEEVLRRRTDRFGPDNRDTLLAMNNVACALATAPDAKLRDPTRALRLAKTAAQHMPKNGACWGTLGAACYRAGDWNQAIEALEKSESLSPGQYVDHNGFFLAMAHWQRGSQADARQWYERAVQWMEKNNPKDAELRRLREEASKLLGVSESQAEKKRPSDPRQDGYRKEV
jgi:tetratricopeptide (TPR) repeat protein